NDEEQGPGVEIDAGIESGAGRRSEGTHGEGLLVRVCRRSAAPMIAGEAFMSIHSLPVTGMADEGAFIVSVEDERGIGQHYFTHVFHHELGHGVDIAMNGRLYDRDVKWAALNGKKFRGYTSSDGWTFRTITTVDDDVERPGFLTKYCTSCVQEEKA